MLNDIQKIRVCDLVQYLLGTNHSLAEGCEACGFSEEELTEEMLQSLDEQIFQCSGCGWWEEICERNDLDGDALCDDCLDMEVHQD